MNDCADQMASWDQKLVQVPKQILEGPNGGRYYLNSRGHKVYLKPGQHVQGVNDGNELTPTFFLSFSTVTPSKSPSS